MAKKMIRKSIYADISAGIVVFLVALPLCLGVALASGAPLLSGLISGIVGGIVVGWLSQSHVSVSGPAAGLATVVLASITGLGSFEMFLLSTALAGLIQIGLGYLRGGFIANFIPSTVIKGLLSSIGLVLILKQIPHALGIDKDAEGDFSFVQADGENTFSELLNIFNYFSAGSVLITIISFVIMISWDRIAPLKKLKFISSPLVVVIVGILINQLCTAYVPFLGVSAEHLVNVPKFGSISDLFHFPNFTSISNPQVWGYAFMIAIVASIESLLNLEAVETIDPHKRFVSPNKELIAQGVGNLSAGLLGGIPISSVIVRSSVNVNAKAESKKSTIFHGILLLISVLLLSPVLNLIPVSSLATILIITGYKLVKPSIFKDLYKKGFEQFIPFIVTVVAILFTDLLMGIVIGSGISVFYILRSNYKYPFSLFVDSNVLKNDIIRIELPSQVSFLNKATIKDTLRKIEPHSQVIIDARYCDYIHPDIVELIRDFKDALSVEKNIKVSLVGLHEKYELKDTFDFVHVFDQEMQQKLSIDEILTLLKEGNERFIQGKPTEKYLSQQMLATSKSQHPIAVVISCMDSRTTVEHIFDLGFGSIFSIRIAGNVINDDILGSIEYATQVVGAKLVLVIGHTQCGAIKGACDSVQMGHLTPLLEKMKPAIDIAKQKTQDRGNDFIHIVTKENILNAVRSIPQQSEIVRQLEKDGKVKVVGALYDIKTGVVSFL